MASDHSENPETPIPEEVQPEVVTTTASELEKLQKDAADYKDKYFRLLAETENTRKRLQKERQEHTQYAIQNMIAEFLNPIDHLENALKFTEQGSEELKMWATGFVMILNQFKDVLTTNGITAMKSEGTQFDPHLHEAIEMVITTDYPPGTVVTEILKGYKMGDRTIRPARVKVAKAPVAEPQQEKEVETPEPTQEN